MAIFYAVISYTYGMDIDTSDAVIYEKKQLPKGVKKWGFIIICTVGVVAALWYGWRWNSEREITALQEGLSLVEVPPEMIHQQPVGYLVYEAPDNFLPKSLAEQFNMMPGETTNLASEDDEELSLVRDNDDAPIIAKTTPELPKLWWMRDIRNNLDIQVAADDVRLETTNNWSIENGAVMRRNDDGTVASYVREGDNTPLTHSLITSSYDESYIFVANQQMNTLTVYAVDPERPLLPLVYTTTVAHGDIVSITTAPDLNRVVIVTTNKIGTFLSYYDAYSDRVIKQEQLADMATPVTLLDWVTINPVASDLLEVIEVEGN